MKVRRPKALMAWAVVSALASLPSHAALSEAADAPAVAQTQPAAAAATQETPGALKVTVAEVTGNVQVRTGEKAAWQKATVGMVVDEGAEFRTGPRSSVRCTIPPDQSFTLDRLGTVKVLTAVKNGTKLKTEMLMKYGRTKYSVEAAGLEHEGTIASPSGTLAVRGTVVSMYDQPPFVPEAVSYTGRAAFRDAHRAVAVGAKNGKKQTLMTDKSSVAQTSLDNSVTDPRYAGARTNSEAAYIASQVSPGGVTSFDPRANILVVTGSTPIRSETTLAGVLPGQLDVVARWFGNANVNLEVFADLRDPNVALNDPKGFQASEFLFPGYGLNQSKSGGQIPYDDRGGPKGGTELAFWNTAPKGVFGIGALLVSGPPVDLKVNVFLKGQEQSIFFIDAKGNFVKSKTLDVTLKSDSLIGGPIAFIPAVPLLEQFTPTEGDTGATATSQARRHRTAAVAPPNPAAAMRAKPVSAAPLVPVAATAAGRRR
jgi:hypothetical protein